MRKVVIFLAVIALAFSCSRELPELPSTKGDGLFGISIEEDWSASPDTKSCLSGERDKKRGFRRLHITDNTGTAER